MIPSDKVKTCPYCESENTSVEKNFTGLRGEGLPYVYFGYCSMCQAMGACRDNEEGALADWNSVSEKVFEAMREAEPKRGPSPLLGYYHDYILSKAFLNACLHIVNVCHNCPLYETANCAEKQLPSSLLRTKSATCAHWLSLYLLGRKKDQND